MSLHQSLVLHLTGEKNSAFEYQQMWKHSGERKVSGELVLAIDFAHFSFISFNKSFIGSEFFRNKNFL